MQSTLRVAAQGGASPKQKRITIDETFRVEMASFETAKTQFGVGFLRCRASVCLLINFGSLMAYLM